MVLDSKRKIIVYIFIFVFFGGISFTYADQTKEIRIGFVPSMGEGDIEIYQELINHLSRETGINFKGVTTKDYAGIIQALSYGQIDFARLGPKSYVEAAEYAEIEALALELNKKGEPGYYGILIAKNGKGITSFAQAKDTRFAFTEPDSTSGYLVPSVMLVKDLKVEPRKYFKSINFSGSHGDSILGVKNGTYDIASVATKLLDRMVEKGEVVHDDFVILEKSDLIPGPCFCARKALPLKLKTDFQNALISFNQNKKALQKLQCGGYMKTNDKTYDIIRELNLMKKQLTRK
ncbi:Phosphonates-binding periplasmic protein [Desulfonema limicola]|uniref:Phosphonates-binding periplasmic protein n=1 Tax=Desulfonema limicola TaxID=45656 RepID=A0A975BDX2_9BACT|nr:phosphate/phosphite/phosphonate ABC transporter substrate-binding protein [Desulfonema limicola]QTA83571.1 Phosphonates-binding periplasmic protein [Desulfonema limicola]